MLVTKTSIIQSYIAADDWRAAIRQAARLPRLAPKPFRAAITDHIWSIGELVDAANEVN